MSGFARTLQRTPLDEPADKYVEMMVAASAQLAELLEEIGLAARIESGRWEPNLQPVDARELADAAAGRLDGAEAAGAGTEVNVDRVAAELALHQLARCAKRHGALEQVRLTVDGATIAVGPVVPAAAPILVGEEPRDLGALIAVRIVAALGGALELDGERLLVRLPA